MTEEYKRPEFIPQDTVSLIPFLEDSFREAGHPATRKQADSPLVPWDVAFQAGVSEVLDFIERNQRELEEAFTPDNAIEIK